MPTLLREMVVRQGGKLTLTGLPFKDGEAVEVVVRPKVDRKKLAARWKKVCARIRALPHSRTITDDDIAAEIAAYRAGK